MNRWVISDIVSNFDDRVHDWENAGFSDKTTIDTVTNEIKRWMKNYLEVNDYDKDTIECICDLTLLFVLEKAEHEDYDYDPDDLEFEVMETFLTVHDLLTCNHYTISGINWYEQINQMRDDI